MQAMHDQDDRTPELVVEAAVEGVVEPFVRRLALRLRQCCLGLQRVVDDDDVGTPPGQDTADRSGDARALVDSAPRANKTDSLAEKGGFQTLGPSALSFPLRSQEPHQQGQGDPSTAKARFARRCWS